MLKGNKASHAGSFYHRLCGTSTPSIQLSFALPPPPKPRLPGTVPISFPTTTTPSSFLVSLHTRLFECCVPFSLTCLVFRGGSCKTCELNHTLSLWLIIVLNAWLACSTVNGVSYCCGRSVGLIHLYTCSARRSDSQLLRGAVSPFAHAQM